MASIGQFGTSREAPTGDPDTFGWFGANIKLTPEMNEVELIDFMEVASAIDATDIAAVKAVKDLFRMVVDPTDFDEFWSLARTNRQRTEDLVGVFQVLLESVVGRPTQPLSGSSPGLPSTAPSSPESSSSPPVSVGRTGRPDLQLLQDEAAETQAKVRAALTG